MIAALLWAIVPVVAAGTHFACTPVRVWDGDGPLWCAEGPRIRLAGIAARESDGSCRANQPCPRASAAAARDALVDLVGRRRGVTRDGHVLVTGPTLACLSEGSGRGDRTAAWCVSPTRGDLSCAMVASGTALVWRRYWGAHRC
jgi:endonuclease YncB( thermonuclease family)